MGHKVGQKLSTSEKFNESDYLDSLLSNFDRSRDSVEVWVLEVRVRVWAIQDTTPLTYISYIYA